MTEQIRELNSGELDLVSGGGLFGRILACAIIGAGAVVGAVAGGVAAAAATGGVGTPVGVAVGGAAGIAAGAAIDDALGLDD